MFHAAIMIDFPPKGAVEPMFRFIPWTIGVPMIVAILGGIVLKTKLAARGNRIVSVASSAVTVILAVESPGSRQGL